MTTNLSLDELTNQALLDQFGDLVQQDHHHTADLLQHIDAIDQRQLWAQRGHPSMFDLCVSRYHMSESTAGKRIGAARTARRFPILFEMVARGEIHLSGVHRLKAHLTPENHEQVLAQAKHKTIREIDELVARLAPRPDVPSTLRKLPQPSQSLRAAPQLTAVPLGAPQPTTVQPVAPAPAPSSVPVPRPSPEPEPLAPGRYKLQVTLSADARGQLKQLQDLLVHQLPSRDPAAIVERALGVLLSQVLRKKAGITDKPRARKLTINHEKRATPAALRREVWRRDEARCAFVGEDGHRCNETRGLEFAHLEPWGKGGKHSAGNLALRCPAHNAFEADRDYGASHMAD